MEYRIKLKRSKQKELIERVKRERGFTWKEFSKALGCGEIYLLNELRNEKRTLSHSMYRKICRIGKLNFDSFIESRLDPFWGRSKGGKLVKNRKNLFSKVNPEILCKPSKELAEIIGIMIGDGSLYSSGGDYQVRVTGNVKDEVPYISGHVKKIFEKTFGLKMTVKSDKSSIRVYNQTKSLVFTLNRYGIPAGDKMSNGIQIPSWINSNETFLKSCLRGIFDTDGCVYPKNKNRLYPTIWFSSASPSIRSSISGACEKLGFNLSKWKDGRNDACIDRKEDVLRFFTEIKFNNPKHLDRWIRLNRLPSSSPVRSAE